jgi:4-hydroxyproline epimerase
MTETGCAMHVIESHTGGEPTRLVIEGGPELGGGPLAERLRVLSERFDHVRRAVVNEPRGSDPVVGALLCAPSRRDCTAGVIFFNNVGYLGMCGHGAIGVVASLAYLGRIGAGMHRLETPVGVVEATLLADQRVSILNVPSWRHAAGVRVEVDGHGTVTGDVAWGGNWFFLVEDHGLAIRSAEIPRLTACASRIREALERHGITGADGAPIDHIELLGPSPTPGVDARGFVLCPGLAYDRSPCGTGTSAKLACLHADGALAPGQSWRQESVIGSVFEACLEWRDGRLLPRITGRAHVNADGRFLIAPDDPFAWGIA